MNKILSCILILLLAISFEGIAQTNPVQVTTQLIPPYSVYLQDYVSGESEKLRVVLTLRDLTANVSDITLRLRIRKDGRTIIQTTPTYNPVPIFLSPGAPAFVSGVDLRGYFRNENLDFLGGYSREEYLTSKAMPEGFYEICFTAYDARRPDVRLSEEGCAIAFLSKNEPPLLNFPACGTNQPSRSPQQIIFSWVPQSFGNPNLAGQLEYEFTLFEVRPPGRNINDVVLSGLPIYTARTNFTQLVYGVAEPILLAGMEYAWRVQAIDPSGRNSFRNGGYSEVCSFLYGGDETDATMGIVQNFNVRAIKHNRAHASWLLEPEKFKEGYRIFWQRIGENGEKSSDWYPVEIPSPAQDSVDWYDLRPEARYLARIQGKSEGIYGPLSDPVGFVTPETQVFTCQDLPDDTYAETLPPPLLNATTNMYIEIGGLRTRLTEVQALGLAGWYRGRAYVQVPMWGNAWFEATFEEIYIDENHTLQRGNVKMLSRSTSERSQEESEETRERAQQQAENRAEWSGISFYPDVLWFEEQEIEDMWWDEAEEVLIIVTEDGDTIRNTQMTTLRTDNPGEAFIIEDQSRDQWVMDEEGKIHKIEEGGLSPGMGTLVSKPARDILKLALKKLRKTYNKSYLDQLLEELRASERRFKAFQESQRLSLPSKNPAPMPSSELASKLIYPKSTSTSDPTKKGVELSEAFKKAEIAYNEARVLALFTRENIQANELVAIAQELRIEDTPYAEFVETKLGEGEKPAEISEVVSKAIIDLVRALVNEKLYQN